MTRYYSLIFAGILDWAIALLHIIAIFLGEKAYRFMDAPELADMEKAGSIAPYFITGFVSSVFILFGVYAFSAAGVIFKMPKLRIVLKLVGWIYVLRGLFLFLFLYFCLIDSSYSHPREIWFSSISFVVGVLHLFGLKYPLIDLEIKISGIGQFEDRLGVFVKRDFSKGDIVVKWNLSILCQEEYEKLSKYERENFCHKRNGSICFYPDPERHVNRSSEPNVAPDFDRNANVAIRDIRAGEELSISESTQEDF